MISAHHHSLSGPLPRIPRPRTLHRRETGLHPAPRVRRRRMRSPCSVPFPLRLRLPRTSGSSIHQIHCCCCCSCCSLRRILCFRHRPRCDTVPRPVRRMRRRRRRSPCSVRLPPRLPGCSCCSSRDSWPFFVPRDLCGRPPPSQTAPPHEDPPGEPSLTPQWCNHGSLHYARLNLRKLLNVA